MSTDELTKSPQEVAADLKKHVDTTVDAVKAIAEDALGRAKAGEKMTTDAKEAADNALTEMNSLKKSWETLEQKLARHDAFAQDVERAKTLGQQFVADEQVKAFLDSDEKRGKVGLSMKAAITSSTADAAGSAGAAVDPTRVPGIVPQGERRMVVRDLLMQGTMDGGSLEFVRETGFTNNAAGVAEGALKAESDIQLELISANAKVIAHTSKASRQIMDDVAQLQSYIDGRLRYGLAFKEEDQLLNGDGTGQNLLGLVPQATAYGATHEVGAPTAIDKLRYAQLEAALAEYPASGHVLNPIDWARIELEKDTNGRYIIGRPQGNASPTMWGLPVVATQAMGVDKFLTGAFSMAAQVFDRWQARVEIATQHDDDFAKNMITMLCEERLALATYRPEAFIYGDLGYVA